MEKADKRKYAEDKPLVCEDCYFWSRRKNGCTRKQCYYLLPKQPEKDTKKAGQCVGCPHGKHSPCIGYCLQKILQDMRKKKSGKEETAYAGRSQ